MCDPVFPTERRCRAEETEAGAGAGWEEEAGVVPSAGHVASRVCSRA